MLKTHFKAYKMLDSLPSLTLDNVVYYAKEILKFKVFFFDLEDNRDEDNLARHFTPDEHSDGFIAHFQEGERTPIIFVKENIPERRRLSALLHEIGHGLDKNFRFFTNAMPCEDQAYSELTEYRANLFESCVLKPHPLLQSIFKLWKNRYKITTLFSAIVFLIAGIIHIIG